MALTSSMAEALRLTRAGNLGEATKVIQAMLMGRASTGNAPVPATSSDLLDLIPTKVSISRKHDAAREPNVDIDVPGSFLERRYGGDAGTLGYRLYVPANARAGMPLVVMLHGCTQSPETFARGTGMNLLADEFGFLVAYPGQTTSANAQRCWNWFNPGDQRRDRGEPALVAGVARQVITDLQADPRRVYVAGLSAGGAAAAVVAAEYPELFAAVGIHSGIACGAARDLPSALFAMQRGRGSRPGAATGAFVPTITFHGDRDTTVNMVNSGEIMAAAVAALDRPIEKRVDTGKSDGGRFYTREVSTDGSGPPVLEQWTIHGAGHAWSGGDAAGSYTDPSGPDASREMLRFFLSHELATPPDGASALSS